MARIVFKLKACVKNYFGSFKSNSNRCTSEKRLRTVALSVYLSVCLSICLSVCVSVCLSICLSVSLSVSVSFCLLLENDFTVAVKCVEIAFSLLTLSVSNFTKWSFQKSQLENFVCNNTKCRSVNNHSLTIPGP